MSLNMRKACRGLGIILCLAFLPLATANYFGGLAEAILRVKQPLLETMVGLVVGVVATGLSGVMLLYRGSTESWSEPQRMLMWCIVIYDILSIPAVALVLWIAHSDPDFRWAR